jgi:hypothetical protein
MAMIPLHPLDGGPSAIDDVRVSVKVLGEAAPPALKHAVRGLDECDRHDDGLGCLVFESLLAVSASLNRAATAERLADALVAFWAREHQIKTAESN